mgnify:CR=1 FL=1
MPMMLRTYDVYTTDDFNKWRDSVTDQTAKRAINARITRMASGNFGDVKKIQSISEARIDVGQGYRLYYKIHERRIIVLLIGGNKKTQDSDIQKALEMAAQDFSFLTDEQHGDAEA